MGKHLAIAGSGASRADHQLLSRWRGATRRHLIELHERYLRTASPFFIEVSGPDPGMDCDTFAKWSTTDAAMWIAQRDRKITSFLWFSSIQASIGVGTVDWNFFDDETPRQTEPALAFRGVVQDAAQRLGLRKLHLLALPRQSDRLWLARKLGFVEEGVLREHFFADGRICDLVCLGWTRRG